MDPDFEYAKNCTQKLPCDITANTALWVTWRQQMVDQGVPFLPVEREHNGDHDVQPPVSSLLDNTVGVSQKVGDQTLNLGKPCSIGHTVEKCLGFAHGKRRTAALLLRPPS